MNQEELIKVLSTWIVNDADYVAELVTHNVDQALGFVRQELEQIFRDHAPKAE